MLEAVIPAEGSGRTALDLGPPGVVATPEGVALLLLLSLEGCC